MPGPKPTTFPFVLFESPGALASDAMEVSLPKLSLWFVVLQSGQAQIEMPQISDTRPGAPQVRQHAPKSDCGSRYHGRRSLSGTT
jgi:hypothetical protein